MFKKGDKVIVKEGAPYDITAGGSEGSIIKEHRGYDGHFVKVKFYKVTGSQIYFTGRNKEFSIDIAHLELLSGDWDT